ncbi:hypothetical protein [Chroococcus sp. FPU101]
METNSDVARLVTLYVRKRA